MPLARLFTAIIFSFSAMMLQADVPLQDFLLERSALLQWDSNLESGIIWKENISLSFAANVPYVIVNFTTIRKIEPVMYDGHRLMISEETNAFLRELFPETLLDQERFGGYTTVSTIFIDPGHGGKDPGAISRITDSAGNRRISEKDVVLQVGVFLKNMLKQKYPDKQVIISRDKDKYVSLEERTELANTIPLTEQESMLFVSIHANASLNIDARGFEVWYLPPEVQRKDLISSSITQDPDVLTILNTLRDEELTIESALLAQSILKSLEFQIGRYTQNRGIRQEAWYVVKNAQMPSVLVEIGFITNQQEALLLDDLSYLQQIAIGLKNGIVNFISSIERET